MMAVAYTFFTIPSSEKSKKELLRIDHGSTSSIGLYESHNGRLSTTHPGTPAVPGHPSIPTSRCRAGLRRRRRLDLGDIRADRAL